MKRFIDYRFCNNDEWNRREVEIETPTFQNLTDVIFTLSKWYQQLEVIRIENLDFKKIEELQLHEIYMEEERRGRHKKKEEDDDIMPF